MLSQEEQKEVGDFQESLANEGGFYSQVGKEMSKAEYNFSIAGMVYSKDDIRFRIILPDNETVTDQKQEEVNMIIKNNMDPKAYKFGASRANNPPSYEE